MGDRLPSGCIAAPEMDCDPGAEVNTKLIAEAAVGVGVGVGLTVGPGVGVMLGVGVGDTPGVIVLSTIRRGDIWHAAINTKKAHNTNVG